jgi:hypothetical protein
MNAPMEPHSLARLLREAAKGRFPPQDHAFEVLPAVRGLAAAVVAFSGHNFIATDLDSAEVLSHLPSQDPGAALSPSLPLLAQRATVSVDVHARSRPLSLLRKERRVLSPD